MTPAKSEVHRSYSRSSDNSNAVLFGVGLRSNPLGEEEAVGVRGWYPTKERL